MASTFTLVQEAAPAKKYIRVIVVGYNGYFSIKEIEVE